MTEYLLFISEIVTEDHAAVESRLVSEKTNRIIYNFKKSHPHPGAGPECTLEDIVDLVLYIDC